MASKRASGSATELAFGRFEHRAELGHGGSGRVVEVADQAEGGALRALKIVSREHAERLGWELEVLAGVAHPSLARVHELLRVEAPLGPPFRLPRGAFVLVEDRAPGAPSGTVMASLEPPRRLELVRRAAAQIAGALDALHARGIAHGDVKPSNVVVTEGETARATLVDLGLAVAFGRGGVGGTPRYLAPEALLGERSPATDVYALGATLYEWIVGASSDATRSDAPLVGPAPTRELPAWVDADLAQLVRACLAERPADRPRVAADVARALGATDVLALLGAPAAVERARRATVVPLVGRAREVERVASAITKAFVEGPRTALVAVRGPPGSGRTRVVVEAVRSAQSELARRAEATRIEVPSLRILRGSPVVPHVPTILFASGGEDEALVVHRAAKLSGAPVVVVLEREAEVPGADLDVVLDALGVVPFGELVRALFDGEGGAAIEAYRRSTRGLPGLLVRSVAEGWMAGGDPRVGPAAPTRGAAAISDLGAGRTLALAAALAGGAIDVRSARRVVGRDLARAAELLVARALASRDADGRLHVADALVDELPASVEADERRAVASALVSVLGPGPGRALARAALGAPEAKAELLAEAAGLRDAGAPEVAAALLARGRRWAPDAALTLAHADALLAAGRVDAAIDVLAPLGATWLRGEALRRAGRWDEARSVLAAVHAQGDGETRALAQASLARVALATGEPVPDLPADTGPRARAFLDEARALTAQAQGRIEASLTLAESARAAVEERTELPAFERARAAARLSAVEASARTAMGDVEGAHEAFERSARLAALAGERHAAAAFLVNLGIGRLELGLLGPALEALTRGAEQLVLLGRDRDAARALYNVANAALLAGDRGYARHAAEGARREAERLGDEDARVLAEVVLADVDVGEGRPRAAERRLVTLAATTSSPLVAARLATARALAGDVEGARAVLESTPVAADAPTPLHVEASLASARVALSRGAPQVAAEVLASTLARLGGKGGLELRLRALAVAADVAEALGDGAGLRTALRTQRSLLDRALASLPPERHAQFRALHARALAVEPGRPAGLEGGVDLARAAGAARALFDETSTSAIAARLVASARAIAAAEHALLVVREPSGALVVRGAQGDAGPLDAHVVRFSTSIVSRCLDRRAHVVSIDAGTDLAIDGGASIHALAVRSVVALPLSVADKPAALYVDDRLRPSAFGDDVVAALDELVGFASIAFAHAARARRERRMQISAARRERSLRASLDEKTREAAALVAERPEQADLVAESPAMRNVVALAARVAASDVSVLLDGESGTGKEVLARFVHRASARAQGPFVAESCAAIPEALFESALFGHARGAFSGAVARRRGLFELADGGTLFLDEIGELPLAMQAKLLRALSAREIRPMGAERARAVDVRVVAASHRDLRGMVARGQFREDLFYRLAVVEIRLPPLRERPEDVEPLVRRFVRAQGGREVEPGALALLAAHAWPGNVRELENEVRRALALDPSTLRLDNLSSRLRGEAEPSAEADLDLKQATDRLERRLVERALTRSGNNVTQAARLLGLSRFGLQKMLARHGSTRR